MPVKQIDFYLISNQSADAKLTLACRLANQLQRSRQKALLITACQQSCAQLDQLMWSYSDVSFNTHDKPEAVDYSADNNLSNARLVELSTLKSAAVNGFSIGEYKIAINLSDSTLDDISSYNRIAEIVESDENSKSLARDRFKSYRALGLSLKIHNIELPS